MIYTKMRNILFLILIVPVSNYLYPAYCDDGDISNYFTDGIWKLDLNVHTASAEIQSHQFMFTFEDKKTNELKLSRIFRFPKANNSSPKRFYSGKKIFIDGGSTDVTPIKITKLNFKQLRSLPMNGSDVQRNFCIYEMSIDALQQSSEDDTSEYNAKYRLTFHAGEMWQNKSDYLELPVEPTSYFYQYNDVQGEMDLMVTGSIRRVEYSD